MGNRTRSDRLTKLAGEIIEHDRDRRAFIEAVRGVLAEHKIASRELDGNRLRRASQLLRELAVNLQEAGEIIEKIQDITGVTALASWGEGLPVRDEIKRQEMAVQELVAMSSKPGAPTKVALNYTIIQLFEVHKRYGATKWDTFVHDMLAEVGCNASKRKVRDVVDAENRRRLLIEWSSVFNNMAVTTAEVSRLPPSMRAIRATDKPHWQATLKAFRRALKVCCGVGDGDRIPPKAMVEAVLHRMCGRTFGSLVLRRVGARWAVFPDDE